MPDGREERTLSLESQRLLDWLASGPTPPSAFPVRRRLEELEEALAKQANDLHQDTQRPCGTCTRSARVLGLIEDGVLISCRRSRQLLHEAGLVVDRMRAPVAANADSTLDSEVPGGAQ